jgi:hypothetical protein
MKRRRSTGQIVSDHPVVENCPGLTWRHRNGKWEAQWRAGIIGFPKDGFRLWRGKENELGDVARKFISHNCLALQSEMLGWNGEGAIFPQVEAEPSMREVILDRILEAGSSMWEEIAASIRRLFGHREPSMEEILASIRRIIAEDDEARSQAKVARINPPFAAEWLIALLMSSRRAAALLGDLEEKFNRNIESRGVRRARALYWSEALRSIGPILWAKAKKLGVIAVIAEMWRRTHS